VSRLSSRFLSSLLAISIATAPTTIASLATITIVGGANADPSAADLDTARTLYKDALDLRKNGDEAGALQKFKGAYALTKSPVMGIEVAKSELALGKLVDAREQALEVDALPVTAKETKASADARGEAKKMAADLKTRIPSLKIRLVDVPYGTKPNVTIDGASVPFEVLGEARSVDPGKHTVAASVSTESPATSDVQVAEGESKDVTISLKGHETSSGGSGGVMPNPTPTPTPNPTPGPTTTTTSNNGGDTGGGGKTSSLVYIGATLTGVGIGVGAVTGIMAMSKASTVKDECPNSTCPSSASSDLDYVKTTAAISTVGFAAAGVGVVLLIVGLASGKSSSNAPSTASASNVSFTPWIGAGSAGVVGAF
jgi:hypothetical protein